MKADDYFYYINCCFPADDNLTALPKPKIMDFIQANDEISSISLFKQFRRAKSHALVC